MQRLRTSVPGRVSCPFALSRCGLFQPFALWRLSVSLRPLVQALKSCLVSGAPWSSAMPPSLGRARVATATTINVLRVNETTTGGPRNVFEAIIGFALVFL